MRRAFFPPTDHRRTCICGQQADHQAVDKKAKQSGKFRELPNSRLTHVGTCVISCIHTSFRSAKSCFVFGSHFFSKVSLGGVIITHDVGRLVFAAAPRSTFDGT